MTQQLPSATEQYSRAAFQQLLNVVRELQEQALRPRGAISMTDVDDGANKLIRVNNGAVEVVDP